MTASPQVHMAEVLVVVASCFAAMICRADDDLRAESVRTWTSADLDKPIEGKAVALADGQVVLRRRDGIRFTVAVASLSIQDQAFLKERPIEADAVHEKELPLPDQLALQYQRTIEALRPLHELSDEALSDEHIAIAKNFANSVKQIQQEVHASPADGEGDSKMLRASDRLLPKAELLSTIETLGACERRLAALIPRLVEAGTKQKQRLVAQKNRSIQAALQEARSLYNWQIEARQTAINNLRALRSGRAVVVAGYQGNFGGFSRLADGLETYTYVADQASIANRPLRPINVPDFVRVPNRTKGTPWEKEALRLVETKQDEFGLKALHGLLERELRIWSKQHVELVKVYLASDDVPGKIAALASVGCWDGEAALGMVDRGLAEADPAVQGAAVVALTQCDLDPVQTSKYQRHALPAVRAMMVRTLIARPISKERTVPTIVSAMGDNDAIVRQAAYETYRGFMAGESNSDKRLAPLSRIVRSRDEAVLVDFTAFVNSLREPYPKKAQLLTPLFKHASRQIQHGAQKACDASWKTRSEMEIVKRNLLAFYRLNGFWPVFNSLLESKFLQPAELHDFMRPARGPAGDFHVITTFHDQMRLKGIGQLKLSTQAFPPEGLPADLVAGMEEARDGWGSGLGLWKNDKQVVIFTRPASENAGGKDAVKRIIGVFTIPSPGPKDAPDDVPWDIDPATYCPPVE